MHPKFLLLARRARQLLAGVAAMAVLGASAATALGTAALKSHYATLAPRLASNAFGARVVLESQEAPQRIEGEVYAVLDHPFAAVNAALADSNHWCDVLILHLNTKFCRRSVDGSEAHLEMRVGKKEEQAIKSASPLDFTWRAPAARPDYFQAEMLAPDGPYDTRDYRLLVEAIPIDAQHTFFHMGYAFSYGGASNFAMKLYLATVARDKVGFTRTQPKGSGPAEFIGGMRGVVERNTMRYYLAIDAYLSSLDAPPGQQLETRLAQWFDATERYPRQLHEVDRDAYLKMKRNEVARQAAP